MPSTKNDHGGSAASAATTEALVGMTEEEVEGMVQRINKYATIFQRIRAAFRILL